MIRGPEPLDPRPRSAEDPLPPAREQLPLPRRRQQAHLEPQLREQHGAGAGTPFSAFSAPAGEGQLPAPQVPEPPDGPGVFSSRLGQALQRGPKGTGERTGAPGAVERDGAGEPTERIRPERAADRAAAFRAATRRGRRPGQHPSRPRG